MLYRTFIWMRMIFCVFLLPSPSHRIFLQTLATLLCLRDRVRLCHLGVILHTAMTGCLPPGGALLLLPRSLPTLGRGRIAQPGLSAFYPCINTGPMLVVLCVKATRGLTLTLFQRCPVALLRAMRTRTGHILLYLPGPLWTRVGIERAGPGLGTLYPNMSLGLVLMML